MCTLLSEQKLQRNLVLENNLFKSKYSVANCVTDRASVHTGNASEQFLHRNRTLILVHTLLEQKPIRYSVNIAKVCCVARRGLLDIVREIYATRYDIYHMATHPALLSYNLIG